MSLENDKKRSQPAVLFSGVEVRKSGEKYREETGGNTGKRTAARKNLGVHLARALQRELCTRKQATVDGLDVT